MSEPLILVTNDDGVNAKGLEALIEVVKPFGKVVVVAPDKSNSAKSHAVTLEQPLYLHQLFHNDGIERYSCSGTPVDCVKIALSVVLDRKPDFLVSGINHGSNSAINIVYSGTMGAAIEGCINGIPSAGFSLTAYGWDLDFTASMHYASKVFKNMVKHGLPDGVCLNVNIPDATKHDINGIKVCRQTKGAWSEEFDQRKHPHGRMYYWLTGDYDNYEPNAEDTDDWAIANNYVAVVPVEIDFTAHHAIDSLKSWNYEKKK